MASNDIIVGARAPEALRVVINTGDSGIDLSIATKVDLVIVKKPSNTRETWTTTIWEKTSSKIIAMHDFNVGDVDHTGVYSIIALIAIPTGQVRAMLGKINIIDP